MMEQNLYSSDAVILIAFLHVIAQIHSSTCETSQLVVLVAVSSGSGMSESVSVMASSWTRRGSLLARFV